jgi:hypothetical protein
MQKVTCMIAKPGNPDVNVDCKEGNIAGALINGAADENDAGNIEQVLYDLLTGAGKHHVLERS